MSASNRRTAPRTDTSRAVAFSDGVLAIVITLLVLDLQPPEHEPGQLLAALLDQWPTYLAYLTSFLYVGVIWLDHKAAFNRISELDRGLQWANLAILLIRSRWPASSPSPSSTASPATGLTDLPAVLRRNPTQG